MFLYLVLKNKGKILFSVFIAALIYFYSKHPILFACNFNTLDTEFRLLDLFGNASFHAIPFDKKWNIYLKRVKLLNVAKVSDEEIFKSVPIIGTAISSNHFRELQRMLRSLSNVYNNTKLVYVYDLGLQESERSSLQNEFSNVIYEIKNFSFDQYPEYFQNLRGFRWKPIVVAELLAEHQSMWWMDSSVRVNSPLDYFYKNFTKCADSKLSCNLSPWILLTPSSHSIYAATDGSIYDYLPMPENYSKILCMWQATVQLIYATTLIKENVLRYWVLCALEEECMVPTNSTIQCVFTSNRYETYAGCHRQDQSAINILLTRYNNFILDRYTGWQTDNKIIDIMR